MDSDAPDQALDLLMVLIAELLRANTLDSGNIASMARRLRLAELPDLADRLEALHFSNEVDSPETARRSFRVLGGASDGGNSAD